MSESEYRICITRAGHRPVYLHPGGRGERDLVRDVVERAVAKGIGFWKTEATVRQAITQAFDEALHDLKSEVRP